MCISNMNMDILKQTGRIDIMLLIDTLHTDLMNIIDTISEESALYKQIKEARPESCTIAILLGHLEDESTKRGVTELHSLQCHCSCVAFDGIYFDAHDMDIQGADVQRLLNHLYEQFRVELQVKSLSGEVLVTRRNDTLTGSSKLAEAVKAAQNRRKRQKTADRDRQSGLHLGV